MRGPRVFPLASNDVAAAAVATAVYMLYVSCPGWSRVAHDSDRKDTSSKSDNPDTS